MKMFIAHGKRVRVATTVKAYMMLKSGSTYSQVADKFAKGHHLFLNGMLKYAEENVLTPLKESQHSTLFYLLGTEYLTMKENYLNFLDETQGTVFTIKYHYYTSHNTKSKSITERIKAHSKSRAQQLLYKKVGGDAIITATI